MHMVGPPGSGKSMLAARLPSILPPLAPAELLEVSMVASIAGEIEGGALVSRAASLRQHAGSGRRRPACAAGRSVARAPRRFVSRRAAGIPAASARLAAPTARNRRGLDRARQSPRHYPARLMLVAAMNPCRCGKASEPGFACGAGRTPAAPPTTRRAFQDR